MSLVIAVPYAGEEHQVGGCPQGTDVGRFPLQKVGGRLRRLPRGTHLISAVSARDARAFFEHGGYHLPVQLL